MKPRGSGVPPADFSKNTAGETPEPQPIHRRQGNYLPHWTREDATYAVTFRLGDSLPSAVLESWLGERRNIVRTAEQMGRPLSDHEEKRLRELHSERVETWLDSGHGACWMRRPAIAQLVADALRHFDVARASRPQTIGNTGGTPEPQPRYRLHAWCVMPNHVHALVEPFAEHKLPAILHSWKSFTAKAANRLLGRTGEFWQEEYYDHLIRDEADHAHALRYILENPVKAGLTGWQWSGSSSGSGVSLAENPGNSGSGILPAETSEETAGGTPELR